jgi:phage terminase small subunit
VNLTAKQELFCQAIVAGENQTDAYRQAYSNQKASVKTSGEAASRLLKNSKVIARLDALRQPILEKVVEKIAVDKAWVLGKLVNIVDMGMQAEPVVDNEGANTGEYKQNLAAANKALELVGKEIGMFVERKEVKLTTIQQLADADLANLITQKAKEAGVSLH